MAKNIVVYCDGTANKLARDWTNVVKLFYALDHSDPSRQVAYYHTGLGTMKPSGASSGIRASFSRESVSS